jgi:signal transduction histidine kinase
MVLRHHAWEQHRDRVDREAATARTAVARRVQAATQELGRAARAFAGTRALQAAAAAHDLPAVREALRGLAEVHGWGLLVATDYLGRALGSAGQVPPEREILASAAVDAAVAGTPSDTFWAVGDDLYRVRVEPLRHEGRVLGALALGQRLDREFLAALRGGSAAHLRVERGDRPVAATSTAEPPAGIEPLALGAMESGERVSLRILAAGGVGPEVPWGVLGGAAALWLIGSFALGWIALRPHREQVAGLARAADRIARGDLESAVDAAAAGEPGAAMETMRIRLRRRIEDLEARCRDLAGALDLERRIGEQAEHRLEAGLREQLRRADQNAAELAHELKTPAATVAATMHGMRHGLAEWLGCIQALDARSLGPEHARLFHAALEEIHGRAPLGRPPEPAGEGLAADLEAHEVKDPDRAARVLIRTGLAGQWRSLLPLLRRPDAAAILGVLEAFGRVEVHLHSGLTAVEVIAAVARGAGGRDRAGAVDVRRGIEDALAILDHEMRGRVDLRQDLLPLPAVRGDGTELCQVWTNLIHNAVQAMGPGGGRLEVEARAEGGVVVVGVTDSGPGVDRAIRDRLFDPYVTTRRPADGSGLGLSVARRIVEAHGGRISVDSAPGRTRFEVRLPRCEPGLAASPAGAAAAGGEAT